MIKENSNINAVDEKLVYCDNLIKFYSNRGDENKSLLEYWQDYKSVIENFKKSGYNFKDLSNISAFGDSKGKRDAAIWIKDNFMIDMTNSDEFVSSMESKKEDDKYQKERVNPNYFNRFNDGDQFTVELFGDYYDVELKKSKGGGFHNDLIILDCSDKKKIGKFINSAFWRYGTITESKKENRIIEYIKNKKKIQEDNLDIEDENSLEENSLEEKIVDFFKFNPYPSDEKVHNFADNLNIPHDEMERKIYELVSTFLCGGKSFKISTNYNPLQLEAGIKVEYEHIDRGSKFADLVAEKIVKDHLIENKNYYIYLLEMEEKMEEENDKNIEESKQIKEEYLTYFGKLEVGKIFRNENGDKCKVIVISREYPDVSEYDITKDAEYFWKKYGIKNDKVFVACRNLDDGEYYVYWTSENSRILGEKKDIKESVCLDVDGWIEYLSNVPDKVFKDLLIYYANRRRKWNMQQIRLRKSEIKNLINFKKAISKLGIDEKEFALYVTV